MYGDVVPVVPDTDAVPEIVGGQDQMSPLTRFGSVAESLL